MRYNISVIIPVYKVEEYLDQCVQSVLAQTLKEVEIILVDDQSPDRCPMMCDQYAQAYPNIKVIHKQNAGLGMACNSGLDVASGEYVVFLDSDDWVDTNMYKTMVEAAEEHHCDMVFTGLKRVDSNGSEIGRLEHRDEFQFFIGTEIQKLAKDMIASSPEVSLERTIQMSAKVVLYRRSVIQENNIRFVSEREITSEDLHFNLQCLSKSGCVCVLPHFFYNYRCNPLSITQGVKLNLFEKYKALYYYLIKECTEIGIDDVDLRIQRLFIGYCRTYIRQLILSDNPSSKKKKVIHELCKDSIWKVIRSKYPLSMMPIKHRVFFFAMYYDSYIVLKVLSLIRK